MEGSGEDKENNFDSKTMAITLQKKLLSKMMTSNKKVAKLFVDDRSAKLLDAFYVLCKKALGSKKEAEALIKKIIKICIKIGVLGKNQKFNAAELESAQKFQQTFRTLVLTIISFSQVEYSYDQTYLIKLLFQSKNHIKSLVQNQLSPKSLERIDQIYEILTESTFLDKLCLGNLQALSPPPIQEKGKACKTIEEGNCGKKANSNDSKHAKILLDALKSYADEL